MTVYAITGNHSPRVCKYTAEFTTNLLVERYRSFHAFSVVPDPQMVHGVLRKVYTRWLRFLYKAHLIAKICAR